jgi:uncharacterized membrane protein YheB (UPF0754 family)
MSANTVQSFVQKLISEKDFHQQLMAEWGQNRLPSFEEFAQLAARHGYKFEAAELIQQYTSNPGFQNSVQTLAKEAGFTLGNEAELSPEELDVLVGGSDLRDKDGGF